MKYMTAEILHGFDSYKAFAKAVAFKPRATPCLLQKRLFIGRQYPDNPTPWGWDCLATPLDNPHPHPHWTTPTCKYSSMDTSPYSNYVMHPFLNCCVKLVPLNVAANLLTFTGFLLLPLSFLVLAYYDFDFENNYAIPQLVWLMCAFNNCMSHILDGIDGKQARRTNTSSVLGELFDHGLDAWSTTFFAIAIYDIFGQGYWGASTLKFLFLLIAILSTFVFSHWEKYNTGILYLPWAYDLALTAMTIAYVLTYLFGVEFWHIHIPIGDQKYTIAFVLQTFLYVGNCTVSIPMCMFNVFLSYQNRTGKLLSFSESIRPLLPVIVLFPTIVLWAAYSQSQILDNHPRCYYTLTGILFANIVTRMIVNQMSGTRAQAFNWLLVPLLIITPLCVLYDVGRFEAYILYGYTALSLLAHIDYGYNTVKEIADYLNIYVFSVEKKPPKAKSS